MGFDVVKVFRQVTVPITSQLSYRAPTAGWEPCLGPDVWPICRASLVFVELLCSNACHQTIARPIDKPTCPLPSVRHALTTLSPRLRLLPYGGRIRSLPRSVHTRHGSHILIFRIYWNVTVPAKSKLRRFSRWPRGQDSSI